MAAGYLARTGKQVEKKLKVLNGKNYGEELKEITIISICLPKSYYQDGDFQERRLFKRKERYADIRLRLCYEDLKKSNDENKYNMYVEHILLSLETLRKKVSKDFKLDELITDVYMILNEQK